MNDEQVEPNLAEKGVSTTSALEGNEAPKHDEKKPLKALRTIKGEEIYVDPEMTWIEAVALTKDAATKLNEDAKPPEVKEHE